MRYEKPTIQTTKVQASLVVGDAGKQERISESKKTKLRPFHWLVLIKLFPELKLRQKIF